MNAWMIAGSECDNNLSVDTAFTNNWSYVLNSCLSNWPVLDVTNPIALLFASYTDFLQKLLDLKAFIFARLFKTSKSII